MTYDAVCSDAEQSFGYRARIEGRADGSLSFEADGEALSDFVTNRTGFVVLHPLDGVVGRPVTVEHTDGAVVESSFPELIDPACPFHDIRALTHEIVAGREGRVPHGGRRLRDGGPPQLDGRLLQDLRAAAGAPLALPSREGREEPGSA